MKFKILFNVFVCFCIFAMPGCDADIVKNTNMPDTKISESDFSGVILVYEPQAENVSQVEFDSAIAIIRTRLDSNGYNEAWIDNETGNKIKVSIPNITSSSEIADVLGVTAKLEFIDAHGNVIMTGSNIKNATPVYQNGQNVIELTFDSDGQKIFAKATSEAAASAEEGNNYISIFLDGAEISRPSVNEAICSESCIISGSFDAEQAKLFADQINSGTLPFSLKLIYSESVAR